MPRNGDSKDQNHSLGNERFRREMAKLADPQSWGEPLSYVDLLMDPTVQDRVAKLIVRSAIKRHGRRKQ